jgi:hypothetical protein
VIGRRLRSDRHVDVSAHPPVGEVASALDGIVELGPGRLPDDVVAAAGALRRRFEERLALGDGLTVVALAGGTGVGKSALVNRIIGTEVATEGVRRPTTGSPLAVFPVLDGPTEALLDWLEIEDRRVVPSALLPVGLVLIDLPDHDSVVEDHRRTSARLARRVDGLVIVVDQLKYARADLHQGPLAELTAHADVVTVALNRSDELDADDLERCRADLVAHLTASGHPDLEPLVTSAATGVGVAELRDRLVVLTQARTAASRRLSADAAVLAMQARAELPSIEPVELQVSRLLDPLMEAADSHRVTVEAEAVYRRDAQLGVRSPLARLGILPFRAVGAVARSFGVAERSADPATRTTSAARIEAVLAHEVRLTDQVGPAHAALARSIGQAAHDVAPALVHAVDGVGVRPSRRWWWSGLRWVRGAAELALLVGLVWLVLLAVGDWLQLPEIPTPRITEALTWPTALFLGGLLVRGLLGLTSRLLIKGGARRHREAIDAAIRRRVGSVVLDEVVRPYEAEVAAQRRLRAAVETLETA